MLAGRIRYRSEVMAWESIQGQQRSMSGTPVLYSIYAGEPEGEKQSVGDRRTNTLDWRYAELCVLRSNHVEFADAFRVARTHAVSHGRMQCVPSNGLPVRRDALHASALLHAVDC